MTHWKKLWTQDNTDATAVARMKMTDTISVGNNNPLFSARITPATGGSQLAGTTSSDICE